MTINQSISQLIDQLIRLALLNCQIKQEKSDNVGSSRHEDELYEIQPVPLGAPSVFQGPCLYA